MTVKLCVVALFSATICCLSLRVLLAQKTHQPSGCRARKSGTMVRSESAADTTPFKKPRRYTIGFSNASISNIWAVGYLHALEHAAEQHEDLIKQVIITDANDNPTKQVSDIQDLLQRNVDILIVRPSTEAVDAAVVRAVKKGVPVVLGDVERRRTATRRS